MFQCTVNSSRVIFNVEVMQTPPSLPGVHIKEFNLRIHLYTSHISIQRVISRSLSLITDVVKKTLSLGNILQNYSAQLDTAGT